MNNTAEHQRVVNETLLLIGSLPYARAWKQVTGVFRDINNSSRIVSVGIPGAADIGGIVLGGRRLEIEIKTGKGRKNAAQNAYGKMIEKFGGIYILAHTAEDALAQLKAILYP